MTSRTDTMAKPADPRSNAANGEAPPSEGVRNGRTKPILLAITILLLIAGGTFAYWYYFMRGIVSSDDARMAGHVVDLAPEINDRLTAVLVTEGQSVRRGQDVFILDSSTQKASVAQAQAALDSANATLAASEARYDRAVNGPRPEEIKAADAVVKRLQSDEDLARVEYERSLKLLAKGASAIDESDRAKAAYESALQSREYATQNLLILQLGSRKEDLAVAKADVELAKSRIVEARAALDHANSDLERCRVTAPFDGWVVRRWLDPGAMPIPGQPVVSLFDPATLRVDANIEEKYLHQVAIGDDVDVAVDAYPSLSLKGKVTEILRATNSQFSLIPAEGVSGTFIKVTQRVPLRITVTAPADLRLGPGLSADVRVHIGSAKAAASQPSGAAAKQRESVGD